MLALKGSLLSKSLLHCSVTGWSLPERTDRCQNLSPKIRRLCPAAAAEPEPAAVAEIADLPIAQTESQGRADAGENDRGDLEGGSARRHPDAL